MDDRVASTVFSYGSSKQLCLAIPVHDLKLMEKSVKACFVQFDIDEIADLMSFQDDRGTWFGLYYQNGESLSGTNPDFSGRNILTIIRDVLPEAEAEKFRDNFTSQNSGSLTFIADGAEETMCYVPIPDTGWMLTAMIRESVIHDQIRGISRNSLLTTRTQIMITLGSMLLLAAVLLLQQRDLSRRQLEAEKKTSSTFKNMATTDSMTGVGNKHAYLEYEAELNQRIQNQKDLKLAVVVGDLNGLKHVNDTLGHSAGDRLIRDASELLRKNFANSRIFRIGGDEFVTVLLGKDYEARETILADLNQKIEANIKTGDVVISLGWSELQEEDSEVHEVFHRADKMMYERKKELKDMGAMTRELFIGEK
jgi:diguanylate cyclase (GGDEF)-like protein